MATCVFKGQAGEKTVNPILRQGQLFEIMSNSGAYIYAVGEAYLASETPGGRATVTRLKTGESYDPVGIVNNSVKIRLLWPDENVILSNDRLL